MALYFALANIYYHDCKKIDFICDKETLNAN